MYCQKDQTDLRCSVSKSHEKFFFTGTSAMTCGYGWAMPEGMNPRASSPASQTLQVPTFRPAWFLVKLRLAAVLAKSTGRRWHSKCVFRQYPPAFGFILGTTVCARLARNACRARGSFIIEATLD